MKLRLLQITRPRVFLWLFLGLLFISVSTLTRTALLIRSWSIISDRPWLVPGIYFIGFVYDVIAILYASVPMVLYLWLIPGRVFRRRGHRFVVYTLFFVFITLFIFNSVAEWLFWDEFNARFNFIAVDYLVYTTEVVGNINQSYPMPWIISGIVVAASVVFLLIRPRLELPQEENFSFRQRSKFVLAYGLTLVLIFFTVNTRYHHFSKNAFANELAGNGLYELFAAYRNNVLDYDRFFKGISNTQALDLVNTMIVTPEATLIDSKIPVERKVVNPGPEKKLNVVLISVESFSADFMALFGNTKNITPFLDSLSQHSMTFTNLYATGTRTVRGLEALSLCVPPTPGQSIVRRPENRQLFSLGSVFKEKGYHCEFIYGGYGYFDNMNDFFSNNDYEVVDRTALSDEEIHYENIWGVADEDLFTLSLREIDNHVNDGPVFTHIMTTSNHRPFTYPEGRIDIPSHTGREGAVKYTDYSIGQFIKKASHKSWFANTVFVIVADHCASSAGKTELPVNKYHIPMLIYSPGNIQPMMMNRLMSQIDLGPTLLGLLNFSYTSKFYGYDIFKLEPGRERAFISTYQNLGYLKDSTLVILSPLFSVKSFTLSPTLEPAAPANNEALVNEAIAWYEIASDSFRNGRMRK